MKNSLESLYAALPAQERIIQFGRETNNPLQEAFIGKRTTHAGLVGIPLQTDKNLTWQTLMQAVPKKGNKSSAYIHIPFCQTKCLYCMFYQNACQQEAMDAYVDILVKEIEAAAKENYIQNSVIQAVFFGGGTPSSLSPTNAARLIKTVKNSLPLANDYEMTMEGRVSDLIPEKLESWFANGVNRISVGVQSFDSKVRQQIGRIDAQDKIIENLKLAAAYNQASLIVDLMFGLPDQDMRVWERDLEILASLPVDGADLYQLNLYENSALQKAIDSARISPAATTAEQASMFAFAHDWLSKRAYKRLSHCHWSKDNRERSLYNTLSKSGADTIPFGCGAGGNIGGYSLMLHRNIEAYKQLSKSGIKPIMVMSDKNSSAQFDSYVTAQLEQGYLDFAQLLNLHGLNYQALEWLLEFFCKNGLLEHNGVMYKLTLAGQFWVVNITQTMLEAAKFIREGEHSLTRQAVAGQG